ncbi:serine hydrolase [Lentzea sp. NBRC 105346]|uniref:serine hydrolase domain-containing protein n=1 Tax=Lentzea sp. NBRC 105346 TaxID=3032205 RepID=UPI0024A5C089|nr:serine hydrolase domain-containing protein [Lentzea sp. NBRC 105346]GLZ31809.1 serine hydrolase [Lentzea sp. NBRC 105346]
MKLLVLGAAVALTLSTAVPAHAATPADILRAGAEQGVRDGYPGVIGLVRNGTDSQYVKAGLGDRFAQTPADPHARFRIGSNTKAFTAAVLLQLESEGRLSLDDTVARWLPGVVDANGHDGTRITIRQLLNHTSGLPEYSADARVSVPYVANTNPRQPWPPRTLVDIALEAAPVRGFHYANTNYVLAGMVIKAVTGEEPAVQVRKRIIEPLGLRDTTFPVDDPETPSMHGAFWVGSILIRDVTVSNVQTFGPAGAIVSTVDDLATFERALFTGRLFPAAQLASLKTTVPMGTGDAGYGLGVGSVSTPCGRVWTHTGGVLGYFTTWLTSEDGAKQVVFAANEFHLVGGTRGQRDVGKAAVDAYCALQATS